MQATGSAAAQSPTLAKMTGYSEKAKAERYGITVDTARCTGCGACVEACPTGALYLVAGKAAVDNALCRGCEACLRVCPEEALTLVALPAQEVQPLTRRPEPEVLRIRTAPLPVPWRQRVLPVVGAAVAWAGREIVPRVVDVMLDAFDRRTDEREMTTRGRSSRTPAGGGKGGGRQHRHRRRGGR